MVAWLRRKLAFIVGRKFFQGFLSGSKDEVVSTFTDAEISISDGLIKTMKHCEPWTDHVTVDALDLMTDAIRAKDERLARAVVSAGATAKGFPWCVEILKTAVTVACDKCPSILLDALPMTYY